MTDHVGFHRPLCPDGRTAADAPADTPCQVSARPFVLAATILASAMAFIDGSIVTIALPVLQVDLGASFASLQWVVNAYLLLLGSLILIGGSAGDRFGRKRIFVLGLVIFTAASLACATAPSVRWLIAARSIQGVGAALLVPQSLAIIAAAFPRDVRGRAIGIWAGASAVTTALGPPLGGVLIDWIGWRSVFWINLPLAAAALWLAASYVPESRDKAADGRLDWIGGALAIVGFGGATGGLTLLAEPGATNSLPLILLGVGLVSLIVFLRIEMSAARPLVPLSLFASRDFAGANVMTLLLYGALSAALFLLPFDLIERRGLSAIQVGLTLLPFGLIIGIGSRFAGAWADRDGPRWPLVLGSTLVAAAAAGLGLAGESLWIAVLIPILVMSLGMAIVVAPLTTAVMNSAPDVRSGAASGINNAVSRLAGLFAVAIVGAASSVIFADSVDASFLSEGASRFGELPAATDPSRMALETAFVDAYRASMFLAAAWAFLAALIAGLYVSGRKLGR